MAMTEQTEQQQIAEKAARLKAELDETTHRLDNDDHSNEGIVSTPFQDQAPSGAFDAEGHRPVLERSRKVR
ncbi:hypothetical protein DMC47_12800 [Nostoc sp. 3335mG]|nr:hypothetical protein DMC47_12800 [Nostoc sp. 3335mG]